ncbi:unannotated protein [freshwater metagenome]|uniref:Unannotated protein n=1 Tax=freshwater metagenome TaxID=449393 RepID=A0A6J6UKT0_9ZZZZ
MVAKVVSTISPPSAVVVDPAPGSTVVVDAVLAVVEELSLLLEQPANPIAAVATAATIRVARANALVLKGVIAR